MDAANDPCSGWFVADVAHRVAAGNVGSTVVFYSAGSGKTATIAGLIAAGHGVMFWGSPAQPSPFQTWPAPPQPLNGAYGALRSYCPDFLDYRGRLTSKVMNSPISAVEVARSIAESGASRVVRRLLDSLALQVHDLRGLVRLLLIRLASVLASVLVVPPDPVAPPGHLITASRRPTRGPDLSPLFMVMTSGRRAFG